MFLHVEIYCTHGNRRHEQVHILACKYISPTGIEIVSVVVQIIPTGKNLPHRLQMRIFVPLHGNETG